MPTSSTSWMDHLGLGRYVVTRRNRRSSTLGSRLEEEQPPTLGLGGSPFGHRKQRWDGFYHRRSTTDELQGIFAVGDPHIVGQKEGSETSSSRWPPPWWISIEVEEANTSRCIPRSSVLRLLSLNPIYNDMIHQRAIFSEDHEYMVPVLRMSTNNANITPYDIKSAKIQTPNLTLRLSVGMKARRQLLQARSAPH